MAKNISPIFKFQGTLDQLTFVKSRTYGPHVRTKRGTYTPVKLNKTMRKCKEQLMKCNKQAKAVFDALREEVRDGSLWWRLLRIFFARGKEGLKPDVRMLAGLECDSKHPLERLLGTQYKVNVERKAKALEVIVELEKRPSKPAVQGLSHYRLYVVVLYPSFPKARVQKEVAAGEMLPFETTAEPLSLTVGAPSATAPYVLLLGIMGYERVQKEYYEVISCRGLAVVQTS